MNKIKETLIIMLRAVRYSLAFCWRGSRLETIGRLVVALFNTTLAYLLVQVTGLIINELQSSIAEFKGVVPTIGEVFGIIPVGALALMVGMIVVATVVNQFDWYYRSKWNQRLRYANQRELNNHRATLDVARFRSKEYDDLQRRISDLPQSWQTRIGFAEEMLALFMTSVSFVLFGASLLWYKPIYAAVLLVTVIPAAVVAFQLVNLWWELVLEQVPQGKKRHMLERPYHSPQAFVQALMFNQMPALRREIDINTSGVEAAYNKVRSICVRREVFTNLIASIGLCGVVIHAVWTAVQTGEIGTFTIILAASRAFQGNLSSIVSSFADQWNSARGVILIEEGFLGLKPVIKTEYPVVPSFNIVPTIRFDHVSFSYPDTEEKVLKDVSFTIEPGTKVAIVGKSGNGKSTIQALLMRHYDPTSGSIFVGDVNLRNIAPNVWCEVASSLTQEFTVLERPIGAEIASSRLGQPLNLEAVRDSAKFANFDEVVDSDPKGYDSQIGVEFGGRDFSGGEKQRLALARVHYRGTPVLILDEPDAKLDPESALKVIDKVFALKGVTIVMITHHVSRAERCDKVIVMGKGEVVEEGTHGELMARRGVYASMCEKDKKRLGVESD